MVGNSLPGRLKLAPVFFGTILRIRISSTSPGSAPFTNTGPVSECGPPPGFALRSSTIFSIEVPGLIWSLACISVSIETVSPDWMVSLGGSFGSSQPHCTFSGVALSTWCFAAAGSGAAATAIDPNSAAPRKRRQAMRHPCAPFSTIARKLALRVGRVDGM